MKTKIYERISRLSGLTEDELKTAQREPSNFDEKKEEKHRNLDLFVCPSFVDVSPKSDRQSMEHPFFALSQKKNKVPFVYKHSTRSGDQSITITPGFHGNPLQTDKDIIIFAVSQLMKAVNAGEPISPTIRFGLYDFAVTTNKSVGTVYREIENTLRRLSGCRVETTIKAGGVTETSEWGFINVWKTQKQDASLKGQVEITLSDYLMRAIEAREVLSITRDYFRISGNFKRRLFELARKHTGKQKGWVIKLELLQKKCGSTTSLKAFRGMVKKVQKENDLPDYVLRFNPERDTVVFLPREKPREKPARPSPMMTAKEEAQRELDRKNRTLS